MRKILLVTCFVGCYILAQAQYIPNKRKIPVNPLWWEQFYTMKKNDQGIIPRLNISLPNTFKKQQTSILENVSETGPFNRGGRTRALLVDRGNHNRIFAGGVSGGLWVSDDKGASWDPINDFASTLSITCITQNKKYPHIMYYGTGESAGNSAGIPGNGVFKSTDNGKTFLPLASTSGSVFDYVWSVKASPSDSNTVYVGTASSGLYRSIDGGTTFAQVYAGNAVTDIEILPNGTVFIAVHSYGILSSPSGDQGTYVKATSNLPASMFKRVELAYCDSTPSTMYAAFENNNGDPYYSGLKGIWKTTDGGITWNKTLTNPDEDYNFFFSFVWYSLTLCVKPDDPDYVVIGVGDLAYTTDGGETWGQAAPTHADHHSSVFDLDDPNLLYIGSDGGVFLYDAMAIDVSADDLNNGYNTQQYYAGAYFPAGVNALAGAQDNGTQHCKNNNPDFEHIFGGDGSYTQVNQQTPSIAYVSYQNGAIFRGTYSGGSFGSFTSVGFPEISTEGAWFINPFEINLRDGNQLYFVTYERIWRTTDGGANWDPIMNPITGTKKPFAIGISNSVTPTLYIGGEGGMLYRIDDGVNASPGAEINLYSSLPNSIKSSFIGSVEVHPTMDSTIYIGLSNFSTTSRIWKGTHMKSVPVWKDISGDLPDNLPVNWVESDPLSPDSVLFIGTDQGLYYTINGGTNWFLESALPNVVIPQVKFRDSDRKLFVYTHGRGLWTADVSIVPVGGIIHQTQSVLPVKVYPNPASGSLTIFLPGETNYLVRISDIRGQILKEVHSTTEVFTLDISELAKGAYLVSIDNGKMIQNRKVMKY